MMVIVSPRPLCLTGLVFWVLLTMRDFDRLDALVWPSSIYLAWLLLSYLIRILLPQGFLYFRFLFSRNPDKYFSWLVLFSFSRLIVYMSVRCCGVSLYYFFSLFHTSISKLSPSSIFGVDFLFLCMFLLGWVSLA